MNYTYTDSVGSWAYYLHSQIVYILLMDISYIPKKTNRLKC